ncbi:MAG: EpsG family protein [Clostridium sp.]|nr:EpsG family protein [Roseburia sp.]MCM1432124.1 EpsG family protein [Muribaculaceae bacterium]MCM1499506.1 EpsG family protein [Clostridium sp.]
MLLVIYLFLAFFPFLFGAKNNYKYYDVFVMMIISVLLYCSQGLPDFSVMDNVYETIKNGVIYTDTGMGWFLICKLGCWLGIERYKTLMTVIFVFSLILVRSTINYYVTSYRDRAMIWGMFLIYPVMVEGVQIRFFLAESIVLFGVRYITNRSKSKNILFLLLVFLAATIHSSMMVYVIMWLCVTLREIKGMVPFFSTIGVLFTLGSWDFIRKIASFFVNSTRINVYFYGLNSPQLLACIVYIVFTIIFICIAHALYKRQKELQLSEKDSLFIQLFYSITILTCMIIPFTWMDVNFFRVQRICWIMLYIASAIIKKYGRSSVVFQIYSGSNVKISIDKMLCAICILGNLAFISARSWEIIEGYLYII